MKVLEVGLDWFPEHGGGLDRYFFDLLTRGPSLGLDMRGLVVGSDAANSQTDGLVESFALRTTSLPKRLILARRAIRSGIDNFKPDLIACHFSAHLSFSLDIISKPLVVHFQGPWAEESRLQGASAISIAMKRYLERRVLRRADRCIVLSEAFGDLLVNAYGVSPNTIRVVPGSVEVHRFINIAEDRQQARARLEWPAERPILLAVRRLVRRMGLDNLVDAMVTVTKLYPELLLIVGGRGSEEEALRARVSQKGLSDCIQLVGYISDEDLPLAYRAADLTIVPTEALEGFGLITAESLAAGTPVLVTPIGGLPEAVAPLSRSLILGGSDANHLMEGILSWRGGLLALPTSTECMAYAKERFSWEMAVPRLKMIYEEAISSFGLS